MSHHKTKAISEIFSEASKIRKHEERINFLRSWDKEPTGPIIRTLIRVAYHPMVFWLLPRGIPPYTPNKLDFDAYGVLYKEYHKLSNFVYGGDRDQLKVDPFKRMRMFTNMLEMVHPDDAKLLCAIKDKKINYPWLTYTMMQKAFPDVIPLRDENSWLEEADKFSKETETDEG